MRVEAAATAIHKVVLAVVVAAPHLEAPAAARALQLDDVGGPLFGRAVPGEARRGGAVARRRSAALVQRATRILRAPPLARGWRTWRAAARPTARRGRS